MQPFTAPITGFTIIAAVVLTFTACSGGSSVGKNGPAVAAALPDMTSPLSAARYNNTTDEYAMLVTRYGKPDSVLSTENDSPKPRVPTRIAHYQTAHVKVAFAPNGCVVVYEKAMEILADSKKYPALAKDEMRKIKPCVPTNAGWTIVGYIDSPDSLPISAQLAATRLANPQTTAEMRAIDDAKKAAKKAKDDAEWAKVHEEYLKNLDKSVDPKVVEENLRRNRVESGSGLSETEQLKKGCQVTHLLYDDKRISDLTPKQLQMLQFCGVLGY